MTPEQQNQFEEVRKLYPGTKQGHERELANFIKRSTKPTSDGISFSITKTLPLLKPAIKYQIRYRIWCAENNQWVAQWKNFQTWINKGSWEDQYPEFPDKQESKMSAEQKANNKANREALKKGIVNA